MRRWLPWLLLPLLACAGILAGRATGPHLLRDTDTAVLLKTIREVNDPLRWFAGDWPLRNHFYRPLSSLSFELDNRLYQDDAAGYGLTNALLAVFCVLALFWAVRELTDLPWLASMGALLFGLWHLFPTGLSALTDLFVGLGFLSLLGILRGGRSTVLVAFSSALFVATLWVPSTDFAFRIVGWLPGRTASTMTLFCMVAMAAYGRFERLRFRAGPIAPTALDKPATKGTVVVAPRSAGGTWMWLVVSFLATLGALLCYEQAVMLPAVLTLVALHRRLLGGRPLLWPVAVFWALLCAYVMVRLSLVPTAVSAYQDQQLRTGGGVLLALADYVLPAWNWVGALVTVLSSGLLVLLVLDPWRLLALIAGNVTSWWVVWRHDFRWTALLVFFCAALSFLPMAWLQTFGHYHYWPSALRSVYAVVLAKIVLDSIVTAVSPPTVQAPQRPSPAPGSLPRL